MKHICGGFFSTLANRTRLSILYALRDGEKSVNEIVGMTGFEQSLVSHNLKILRHCKMVEMEVRGKQRIYKMNEKTIVPLFDLVDKHMRKACGSESDGQCAFCVQ